MCALDVRPAIGTERLILRAPTLARARRIRRSVPISGRGSTARIILPPDPAWRGSKTNAGSPAEPDSPLGRLAGPPSEERAEPKEKGSAYSAAITLACTGTTVA